MTGNSLLLAVHTISCQFRLYSVYISWEQTSSSKQVPPTQVSPTPILQVRHVKLEHHCAPIHSANDSDGSMTAAGPRDTSQAYLSHLELLPLGPETKHAEPTYPTIMAVFTCVQDSNNNPSQLQEPFSVISRWELRTANQMLHSGFGQLASKKANESSVAQSPVRLSVCY